MNPEMPKLAKELSAIEVRRLAERKVVFNTYHAVGGVAGLLLQTTSSGASSWLFRKVIGGKRRSIGLGGYPEIDLKAARSIARDQLSLIIEGKDPIELRREGARELQQRLVRRVTFEDLATQIFSRYMEMGKWKNAKHGQQWINTLKSYAFPILGKMVVEDINRDHVVKVLEPIWNTKHETATRVRGRMHDIFETAEADGLRQPPNPASKAQLKTRLITSASASEERHHPSLPYSEIPRFMEHLRSKESMGAKALEFLILTNVRDAGVRAARWTEIDFGRKVWIVPYDRNKSAKGPHEAALSDSAIDLLNSMLRTGELVFPSKKGMPLSDPFRRTIQIMQCQVDRKYLDPQEFDDAGNPRGIVPHGFRATFKTYMSERSRFDTMAIERCMQHKPQNPLDKNYMRSSMLEIRLEAMNEWAAFCTTESR